MTTTILKMFGYYGGMDTSVNTYVAKYYRLIWQIYYQPLAYGQFTTLSFVLLFGKIYVCLNKVEQKL